MELQEQELLDGIASGVVAKRWSKGVVTLDAAQNRMGTLCVNENPEVDRSFEEKELKDEEEWQRQKDAKAKKGKRR